MSGFQGYLCTGLLTNAIDDETISQWVDVRGRVHLAFYVSGSGTTSSGAITFEESLPVFDALNSQVTPQPYAGTAAPIGSAVNASTVSAGVQLVTRPTVGAYGFVRARVSTVIGGGGSVSVGLVAV